MPMPETESFATRGECVTGPHFSLLASCDPVGYPLPCGPLPSEPAELNTSTVEL